MICERLIRLCSQGPPTSVSDYALVGPNFTQFFLSASLDSEPADPHGGKMPFSQGDLSTPFSTGGSRAYVFDIDYSILTVPSGLFIRASIVVFLCFLTYVQYDEIEKFVFMKIASGRGSLSDDDMDSDDLGSALTSGCPSASDNSRIFVSDQDQDSIYFASDMPSCSSAFTGECLRLIFRSGSVFRPSDPSSRKNLNLRYFSNLESAIQ